MKQRSLAGVGFTGLALALLLGVTGVQAAPPDLTDPATVVDTTRTYNLGPTGMRGWIYISGNNPGQEGIITAESRQILVTHVGAGTPAVGVFEVGDVILGVGGTLFTSDARKSIGWAIGEAEADDGILQLKRWRAGVITNVQITLRVLGSYGDTAPYDCPKSALILSNACTILEGETLGGGWNGAISALALLSTGKPEYMPRVRTLARSMAPSDLSLDPTACNAWDWGYKTVFLSEYYLSTGDTNVLHGISELTGALAKSQSMYGTFGHGGAQLKPDGSYNGSISWYGPVNQAGLVANLGIVLGKKALVAGGSAVAAEIDPAIERAANFFGYFVNKGNIPYGEHEPGFDHADNGKSGSAALMFALMGNRPEQTEYYSRMCIAGHVGEEYGHTGQGFSYLWETLGANVGGTNAAAAFLKEVRWHRDLTRRSDFSFTYDGGEQYGCSEVSDYWSSSSYSGLSPTATYVLQYALPLKQLYITGKGANPTNILSPEAVTNAVWAGKFSQACSGYTTNQLLAAFREYDPVVRYNAAEELGRRTGDHAALRPMLIVMAENPTNVNQRQAACHALGYMGTTDALPALGRRLSDPDLWVRGRAAKALAQLGGQALPQLTTMLTAFVNNATDPDVIVWDDPVQIANGYLAKSLFENFASSTINASTNLLYPAISAGLKQPDGMARMYLSGFIRDRLTWEQVQAVAPSLIAAVAERSQADQMFSDVIRYAGLRTLAKYKVEEAIPLCLMVKEQTWHGDDWLPFEILRDTYGTAAAEVLPTLYTWQDNLPLFQADGSIGGCCPGRYPNIVTHIASTIAALEADTPAPELNYFKTVNVTNANLGIFLQSSNSILLRAAATDLDGGIPRFTWRKVSGPGSVSFNPNDSTASSNSIASFDTVGAYVLRVSVTDSSIMNRGIWWKPHRLLGYYDFETYSNNYGTVHTDVNVEVFDDTNAPPVTPSGLTAVAGDARVDLNWNTSFRATRYALKRATFSDGPYGTIARPVSTSYDDLTVTNGTTYYYVVSASNALGESADSPEVAATPEEPVAAGLSINVCLDPESRSGLVGPAGGRGETWNQPLTLSAGDLLASAGAGTSVGFSCSASHLGQWGSPSLSLLTGGAFNWGANDAYTLTLNGLTTGKKYTLYLTSFHPNEDGGKAVFSTSATTDTSSPQVADNGGPNGNASTWVEGVNYARFLNIEPNGSGDITITIDGDDTTGNRRRAYLSGYQLVEAQTAPSTYALTVNGGSGDGSYAPGANVTITAAAPPSGKEFDEWVVNSGSPSIAHINATTTTLTMPAGAVTVTATYKTRSGGPPGYTWCADEGQTVNFTEMVDVAYGANGQFAYMHGVAGAISFDNATFGDPMVGVVKAGYYRSGAVATHKIKVFLLAGQSNMEGQGVVSMDDPNNYNGGLGNLVWSMANSVSAPIMTHLKDSSGDWVVRNDVKVWFRIGSGITKGGLTIGFTGYGGTSHIGPELQFGHVMGDYFDDPVLLVKTAWGGKSLYADFRPPSSGGTLGPYYTQMLAEFNEALADIPTLFPDQSPEYEIAGFVWQQGWNDMIDASARAEYEQNLVNLVNDLRSEFNLPNLPVVIGELGNMGPNGDASMMAFRLAQRNAAARLDHALFVETHDFARPADMSPNPGHGHHWFGNAESYFLIGNALGIQMKSLVRAAPPTPVLTGGMDMTTAGGFTFNFNTVSGFTYRLTYTSSLLAPVWLAVIRPPTHPLPEGWSIASTGGLMTITDEAAAGQAQRFYRLSAAIP